MTEQNTDLAVVSVTEALYTPLKTPHSFRLLRILPLSSNSNDIHCTIHEYDRSSDECSRYTALSYVWGDKRVRRPIQINGKTALVTMNLYESLLQLRHKVPGIFIWIDALCIDQGNPAERGHQVAQMRAIYSEADRVISWLGSGRGDITRLFNTMRRHHRTCTSAFVADGNCISMYDTGVQTALRYILDLAYWTRIWIVQEIVVASSLTLMCGGDTIPWRVFAKFVKMAYYGHFDSTLDVRIHESPRIFRLLHWRHKGVSLADALAWTSGSHATDIRDRIYAVLGLVSTGKHIEADYTLSSCAVFSRAIRVLYADLPAYLHAEARDPGLNWELSWLNNTYKDLHRFQMKEDESEDGSSEFILYLSARALALSYRCEDAARLFLVLFPNYETGQRSKKNKRVETTTHQVLPCGGDHCALNYVLNHMIRLSRAGRGSLESEGVS